MSRSLTAAVLAAASADRVVAGIFVEMRFGSGTVYAWNGVGPVSWNGHTWLGVGSVSGISTLEEKEGVVATGMTLELDWTDPDLLATALTETYQGNVINVWTPLFNVTTNAILTSPPQTFGGLMDDMQFVRDVGGGKLVLHAESYMRVLDRSTGHKRTDIDQQSRFSGDLGMEYMTAVQSAPLNWGRKDAEQTKRSRKNLAKINKKK